MTPAMQYNIIVLYTRLDTGVGNCNIIQYCDHWSDVFMFFRQTIYSYTRQKKMYSSIYNTIDGQRRITIPILLRPMVTP